MSVLVVCKEALCVSSGRVSVGPVCLFWSCVRRPCVFVLVVCCDALCVCSGRVSRGLVCLFWSCVTRPSVPVLVVCHEACVSVLVEGRKVKWEDDRSPRLGMQGLS